MKLLNKSIYLLALFSLSLLLSPVYVRADDAEDDEDAVINDEGQTVEDLQTAAETEADDEAGEEIGSSPFAKTHILFVKPETTDLPAGKLARLLVGFQNNGTTPFIVESIDGSFRYPQDFSYYIQNFSTFDFNKVIEPEREATFEYLFTPSETFSSRQFGFTINLRYKNLDGKSYVNAVFNDTINVVEPEEGLDGETFFLYIFLAAVTVVLLVGGYQLLSVFKKKARSAKFTAPKQSSNGTTSSGDVDLEWIPKEHLQQNKSPRQSPRQRKAKNGGATVSSSGNSSNDE